MDVAIASDHAGFSLKKYLTDFIKKSGYTVFDLGTDSAEKSADYPDFAEKAVKYVISGKTERAIVICGSGVGASVAANKFKGIRAGLCHDTYSAHQAVEHDNINVLCLGSRIIGTALAQELTSAFLSAKFTGEERHKRRLAKIEAFEKKFF